MRMCMLYVHVHVLSSRAWSEGESVCARMGGAAAYLDDVPSLKAIERDRCSTWVAHLADRIVGDSVVAAAFTMYRRALGAPDDVVDKVQPRIVLGVVLV